MGIPIAGDANVVKLTGRIVAKKPLVSSWYTTARAIRPPREYLTPRGAWSGKIST